MTKVRIHELAKDLKMDNKELLKLLEKMGLGAKTVHSTLEDLDVERVKNQINLSHKEALVEQRVKPTVIRRRVKREEAPPPLAPEPEAEKKEAAPEAAQEAAPPAVRPAKPEARPVPKPAEPVLRPEAKPAEGAGRAPEKVPEKPAEPKPAEPVQPPPAAAGPLPRPAEEPAVTPSVRKEEPVPGPAQVPAPPPAVQAPPSELRPEPAAAPADKAAAPPAAAAPPEPAREERRPAPGVERQPERPAPKPPKRKHEPAKIIERPAVPPPSLVQQAPPARTTFIPSRPPAGQRPGPGRPGGPGTRPGAPGFRPSGPGGRPPIILQRPAPAVSEEEERGRRRGKKLKKDVQVLEEGKPNRTRTITTKKRTFRDFEYDERGTRTFVFEREGRGRAKGKMLKAEPSVPKAVKRKIRISEAILVGELAKRMGIKATEVIRKLMELGMMVSINQAIDADAASLVATDFGYEVEKTSFEIEDLIEEQEERPEDLLPRPPVVTIMGHVDHGKTSLLDAIRQTNVTAGEAGGITQHIGAYEVDVDHRKVVFLDTPGHEAFTAMRARGAQVTDIVILVVAADDGVMNQTVEAINHAKAAKVPLIVAVNKIDKPSANPERVKQALTEHGLVPEAWGGETIFAEISAKQKIGLKELLEMILLQAEVLELKSNPNRAASGTVIEAKLDKGRGPVATVLVQNGTLAVGDAFVAGTHFGHVRAMVNDRGEKMENAGPATPVEVIGFDSVPNAGESFVVITDERRAKELALQRLQKQRELELSKTSKVTLEDFYKKMKKGVVKDLNLILKADVQGSIEALAEALNRLSTDAVQVNILHSSVGDINESDCMLASASEAIVLGFNVKSEAKAQAVAEQEKVDIRLYNVIYDALNDVRKAMEGLLEPIFEEKLLGRAEVRVLFHISRLGVIAGSYVREGKIVRGSKARLMRGGQVVHEGTIASLKIQKDDQREVAAGFECGINLGDFRDIQVNDVIESFVVEKVTASL